MGGGVGGELMEVTKKGNAMLYEIRPGIYIDKAAVIMATCAHDKPPGLTRMSSNVSLRFAMV